MPKVNAVPKVMLTKAETARRVGVSVRTLERWSAAGSFPRAAQIGMRATRWEAGEVEAWLNAKIEASRRDVDSVAC